MTDYNDGVIKAFSRDGKGIKIDDNWYNITDKVKQYMENFKKGDKVRYGYENKDLTYIKKKASKAKEEPKEVKEEKPTDDLELTLYTLELAAKFSKDIKELIHNSELIKRYILGNLQTEPKYKEVNLKELDDN